ncbi:MAG: hypothetical protein O9267_11435 [Flavobacterium sp.]|jgi:hypothetical protein|uniref:hypothetical protein n=1 Tax=Flavobacterium sp. TaxID=239 RepID=UPI0022BA848F|nr:hypothetical protein [Flavobacterium sp.]MCZ8198208.1 hypothetical protein [Flavobacterium sp.]
MKKILLAILFFVGLTTMQAQTERQEERQENDLDKMQQEPPRPAQANMERAVRIEAQKKQNEKDAKKRAKKLAKQKAKQPAVKQE